MRLYALRVNGETICEVSADVPVWLPAPKLNKRWLRGIVALALRRYFASRKATDKDVVTV